MLFADKLLLKIDVDNKKAVRAAKVMQAGLATTTKKVFRMNSAMLGFGLSALFTGMAIKKLGEAILKSLVKTYLTATDEQNAFNQQLMAVQAGFEFLKFSIMDALGQSDLVIGFIDGLIQLINRVSEFVSKHPLIAKLIGLFAVTAIVGGGLMQVIGQTTLALIGLVAGFELLKTIMGKVMALKLVAWLRGLTLASFLAALPWILLIVVIGLIIFFFVKLVKQTGGIKNAFIAMGLTLLQILAFIGDAIIESMLLPIRATILLINLLIKAWNALARTKLGRKLGLTEIKEVAQIPTFVLSRKVIGLGQEFMDRVEREKAEKEAEKLAEQKGDVNITVEGDITEQGIIDRITATIDARMEEARNRETGTPQGA